MKTDITKEDDVDLEPADSRTNRIVFACFMALFIFAVIGFLTCIYLLFLIVQSFI